MKRKKSKLTRRPSKVEHYDNQGIHIGTERIKHHLLSGAHKSTVVEMSSPYRHPSLKGERKFGEGQNDAAHEFATNQADEYRRTRDEQIDRRKGVHSSNRQEIQNQSSKDDSV